MMATRYITKQSMIFLGEYKHPYTAYFTWTETILPRQEHKHSTLLFRET